MKLRYLVRCRDRLLFANSLQDIASYYTVTLSGIKYKIKHKLIDLERINVELQDFVNENIQYTIDKYGVVTVINDNTDNTDPKKDSRVTENLFVEDD